MDLSILVVSYNTKSHTLATLKSIEDALESTPHYKVEVLVIDNASVDGSVEALQNYRSMYFVYRFFKNTQNVGFAKANNQLLTYATGEYLLYLNSDMDVSHINFEKLENYYANSKLCGIVTPKVQLESGRLDWASHRGFPTPWASFCYFAGLERYLGGRIFGQYHKVHKDLNETHIIDACTGAFMFMKLSVARKLGGFDERFFMYGEDLDFCKRLSDNLGLKVHWWPHQIAIHKKNKSGIGSSDLKTRMFVKWHFYDAMQKFYELHYKQRCNFLVNFVILKYISYKKTKFKPK